MIVTTDMPVPAGVLSSLVGEPDFHAARAVDL
jgi:hypothetical protein